MATFLVGSADLRVILTPVERVAGLLRDLRIPLTSITGAALVPDGSAVVHGMRAPGLSVPGVTRVGTWRGRGRRVYVVVRKGHPALHLRLADQRYTDVVVTVPSPERALAEVSKAVEAGGRASRSDSVVSFTEGGVVLEGTLTTPSSPVAAALLLSGSGEVDRNSDHPRLALGVTRDLAAALAAAGIASLRYDKRGVGASGGDFLTAGLTDNIDDARAAIAALRTNAPGLPLFLIGHSEGSMIAQQLAAEHPDVAGVVLLAGPAVPGAEVIAWQAAQIIGTVPAPLRGLVARMQRRAAAALQSSTEDTIRLQGRRVNAKWHREFMAFDPRPALGKISAPVLAITGAKDLQVDPDDLGRIAEAVAGPVETHRIPDLTHILRRDVGTPSLSAYRRLVTHPVDVETLHVMTSWVRARTAEYSATPQADLTGEG